jgi:hypothetical protein
MIGGKSGCTPLALRFYLSGLKEAEIPFSEHLVLRQRAPRGSGGRRRASSGRAATSGSAGIDDDEVEAPDGTFEISFGILGLQGLAYLPEEISQEQWEAINQYVGMVIGLRRKAQAKSNE